MVVRRIGLCPMKFSPPNLACFAVKEVLSSWSRRAHRRNIAARRAIAERGKRNDKIKHGASLQAALFVSSRDNRALATGLELRANYECGVGYSPDGTNL